MSAAGPLSETRILLVEDDALIARLGATILRDLGADVTHTDSGERAVAACSEGGVDLVLLDLHLPDRHGADVTDAIRRLPDPHGEVPIVWISSHPAPPAGTDASAARIQGLCPKPFTRDQLVEVLTPIVSG